MIAIDFDTIYRDWQTFTTVGLHMRLDVKVYRNYILAPMILGLPNIDETNAWVLLDPEATETSKCSIELIYGGMIYRRINPYIDEKMQYFFEEEDQFAEDICVMYMRELFLQMPHPVQEPWFAPAGINRGRRM